MKTRQVCGERYEPSNPISVRQISQVKQHTCFVRRMLLRHHILASGFHQLLPDIFMVRRGGTGRWRVPVLRISTFTIAAVFGCTTSVGALTSNQANVLNQGIFYFDTELNCNDINSSGGSGAPLSGNDNGQKIFNYFVSKGYTKDQAAGIVGNTQAESGNVPTRIQDGAMVGIKTISYSQIPGSITSNQQVGWGIVQWTPPSKIGAYAQTTHENPDDLATQVEFLWKQLEGTAPNSNEKPAGDAVKKTTDYADAALAFMNYYERPQDPQKDGPGRVQFAKDALSMYGPQSGGLANPSNTAGSSACGNTGGTMAAACNSPAPSGYDAIKQALSSQLRINLSGDANAGWAAETYNTVCALSKATAYYSKLVAQGPITITLHANNYTCGSGHASISTGVDLYGFCNKDYNRYILAHELGHMYAFRNPAIYNEFLATVWGKYPSLPTWDCQIHFGDGSIPSECWAAMIGEYLVWFDLRETVKGAPPSTPPPSTSDFKQYPTQFAGYYNFAKNELFGGVEYKSF